MQASAARTHRTTHVKTSSRGIVKGLSEGECGVLKQTVPPGDNEIQRYIVPLSKRPSRDRGYQLQRPREGACLRLAMAIDRYADNARSSMGPFGI